MSDKLQVDDGNSRKAAKYRGTKCLNCGHPLDLSDRYCSYCSQLNTSKQLSLNDFFMEFIGSVVTYDSRLRYTVKDLLFKPGVITRNYARGQRLKYANPFRFFLSVSILYFLLQGLITKFNPESNMFSDVKTTPGVVMDSIPDKEYVFYKEDGSKDSINPKKAFAELGADTTKSKEFKFISEADLDTLNSLNRFAKRFQLYQDFYEKYEIKDPAKALDSLHHPNTAFNRWLYNKNASIDRVKEDPFGFINYLLGKVPFFLFFFTPLFAFFFWLIYSRRKFTYMEHMVFIFHIFSFLFLAMFIVLIPDVLIGSDVLTGILIIFIGPFYFYKAMRNFYQQSRIITILKFVFLNVVFWASSSIAALIFFALTAAVY